MTHAVYSYNYKTATCYAVVKPSNYNAQHEIVYEAVYSYNSAETAILLGFIWK